MAWLCAALAIPLLFCLLAYLLEFRFVIAWHSPLEFKASTRISFLWIRRELAFNRADWAGHIDDGEAEARGGPESEPPAREPRRAEGAGSGPSTGQDGFLRVPEGIPRWFARLRKKARRAAVKFALDPPVWRALFRYASRSGRRVIGLLHPTLEHLHVGVEDVLALGGFAAVWSSLSGIFPALAGSSIEYGFNERPASIRLRLAGGFTGLGALIFGLLTLFSFPWILLGRRFAACWRNPRLNRWQRRLLLF